MTKRSSVWLTFGVLGPTQTSPQTCNSFGRSTSSPSTCRSTCNTSRSPRHDAQLPSVPRRPVPGLGLHCTSGVRPEAGEGARPHHRPRRRRTDHPQGHLQASRRRHALHRRHAPGEALRPHVAVQRGWCTHPGHRPRTARQGDCPLDTFHGWYMTDKHPSNQWVFSY